MSFEFAKHLKQTFPDFQESMPIAWDILFDLLNTVWDEV